jgi:hypothetical protein
VIRVQYTTKGQFPKPFSYAVVENPEFPDGLPQSTHIDTREHIGLATSKLQALVDRTSGRVIFTDASGQPVSQDAQPVVFNGNEFRVSRTMPVDEHYFGLGDKAGAQARLLARALDEGPAALGPADRMRLLSSRSALVFLHREVLAKRAHEDWTKGVRAQRPPWPVTLPGDAAELANTAGDRLEAAPL